MDIRELFTLDTLHTVFIFSTIHFHTSPTWNDHCSKNLQLNIENMSTTKFMFATGIENSYPTITLPDGKKKRIDEMEKTGHYKYWQEDLRLVKEMGIEHL